MDLILGYLAGLLTLINPCVLPILPIVLATTLQAGRAGPLALAAGMSLSFVALGLLVASAGRVLGITEETISNAAAVLMIVFGLILLVPRVSGAFATATAGVSYRADTTMNSVANDSLTGQFVGGILLGAVWTPCIGPTLGGAIGLASQGGSLITAGGIMIAFALGVSSIVLTLAYGAQSVIRRRQSTLRHLAEVGRPAMGAVFVAVGLGLLFKLHHLIENWVLDNLPEWFTALSVMI